MPSLTVPVSQEEHVALLQLVQGAQSDFGTIHQIICKTGRATKVSTCAQLVQGRRSFQEVTGLYDRRNPRDACKVFR